MSEKQIPGKSVIPVLLSIVASLSGCAGYQSEADMLAKEPGTQYQQESAG